MEQFDQLRELAPSLQNGPAALLADALDAAGLGYVIKPCSGGIELTVMGATPSQPVPGLLDQLRRLDPFMRTDGAWHSCAIELGQAQWLASGIRYRLGSDST
ncbi:hypothetical protein [Streptacidiphilus melanogenes]|uniref:hypothetical protein n=1 Tax=Streptacidiphilus melanogenes TaxID=411235 RepID=UPI0005AA75A8|nr:hypothetical protein [Streptacidiphilus melanogenes]